MVGADREVGRRRPGLDLLLRAMGEDPVRETLDVSGEDWESILSGGMELDDRLLARLETMIEAMDQAVEWWDEEDDGEGVSEDVGGVELDEGSERPSEEVPDIQGFRHLGRRPTVVALEQNPRPGRHAVDVGLGDALLTELVGLGFGVAAGGSLDALPAGPDIAVSRHAGIIPLCDGLAQWGNDSCVTVT